MTFSRNKLVLLLLWLCACSTGGSGNQEAVVVAPTPSGLPEAAEVDTLGLAPEPQDPVPQDTVSPEPFPTFDSWADSVLYTLTVEEKAGQLLMPWILGDFAPQGSASWARVQEMVENHKIGGVIVSVGSPTEVAVKLNALQAESKVPLLVAADLERGAGFRFKGAVYLPGPISLGGATEFPSMMALGATGDEKLAEEVGRITAVESLALGVHVPFAPVLDVNNNPDNPIINTRSFGENPERVADLGAAYIRGARASGLMTTAKHFPGHGDTSTDSHEALPAITADRRRLDAVELVPFRRAIEAGVDAVMTAHVAVPSARSRLHPIIDSPRNLPGRTPLDRLLVAVWVLLITG